MLTQHRRTPRSEISERTLIAPECISKRACGTETLENRLASSVPAARRYLASGKSGRL